MPLTHFICPDGEHIKIDKCLNQCRDIDRCIHISILKQAAKSREWKGVPSVTQLQKGTCETYLEIIKDYAIKPESRMYALLGTGVHTLLEQDNERLYSEHGFSGLPDWYDDTSIVDFKVTGLYKIKKALGGDCQEWEEQVNAYRCLLKEKDGIDRKNMRIQAVGRDVRQTIGIPTMYWVPIRYIPDEEIYRIFNERKQQLLQMLQDNITECCPKENRWWNDRQRCYIKCKHFCSVNYLCEYNREVI